MLRLLLDILDNDASLYILNIKSFRVLITIWLWLFYLFQHLRLFVQYLVVLVVILGWFVACIELVIVRTQHIRVVNIILQLQQDVLQGCVFIVLLIYFCCFHAKLTILRYVYMLKTFLTPICLVNYGTHHYLWRYLGKGVEHKHVEGDDYPLVVCVLFKSGKYFSSFDFHNIKLFVLNAFFICMRVDCEGPEFYILESGLIKCLDAGSYSIDGF